MFTFCQCPTYSIGVLNRIPPHPLVNGISYLLTYILPSRWTGNTFTASVYTLEWNRFWPSVLFCFFLCLTVVVVRDIGLGRKKIIKIDNHHLSKGSSSTYTVKGQFLLHLYIRWTPLLFSSPSVTLNSPPVKLYHHLSSIILHPVCLPASLYTCWPTVTHSLKHTLFWRQCSGLLLIPLSHTWHNRVPYIRLYWGTTLLPGIICKESVAFLSSLPTCINEGNS